MLCELTERKGEEMVSVLVVSKKFKLKNRSEEHTVHVYGIKQDIDFVHRKPCNG